MLPPPVQQLMRKLRYTFSPNTADGNPQVEVSSHYLILSKRRPPIANQGSNPSPWYEYPHELRGWHLAQALGKPRPHAHDVQGAHAMVTYLTLRWGAPAGARGKFRGHRPARNAS